MKSTIISTRIDEYELEVEVWYNPTTHRIDDWKVIRAFDTDLKVMATPEIVDRYITKDITFIINIEEEIRRMI